MGVLKLSNTQWNKCSKCGEDVFYYTICEECLKEASKKKAAKMKSSHADNKKFNKPKRGKSYESFD